MRHVAPECDQQLARERHNGDAPYTPTFRADAGAEVRLSREIAIYARLRNLNDARYEEIYGYPSLRRNFFAGLKFNVGRVYGPALAYDEARQVTLLFGGNPLTVAVIALAAELLLAAWRGPLP